MSSRGRGRGAAIDLPEPKAQDWAPHDADGDGHSDLLIGAEARAFFFRGGFAPDGTSDVEFNEDEDGGCTFGERVAWVGDVNADGFADFVIAGADCDAGGDGMVNLYLGSATLDGEPDVRLDPADDPGPFGLGLSAAGDVDADGFGDFLIGALSDERPGGRMGRAYLFRGGAPVPGDADIVLESRTVGDRFGQSVAGGDLDGDGWSDVVVGAPDFEHGAAGRVYVYRGHADLDDIPDFVLGGTEDGDQFGLDRKSVV